MKLATNIHHVSGHCCKGFEGQRSKVKAVTKQNVIMADACIRRRRCASCWRRVCQVPDADSRNVSGVGAAWSRATSLRRSAVPTSTSVPYLHLRVGHLTVARTANSHRPTVVIITIK